MKKFLLILFASWSVLTGTCQTVDEMQDNGRAFLQQGDYSNAVLIFNKALQMQPENTGISKDLALALYLNKENTRALEIINPLLNKEGADDQCYQIAGNIYKQLNDPKECEKIYRKGIKRFPNSGPLYNDYGELLLAQQDYTAIRQWEKGIEMDPGFSKNYYNACKYYYMTTDRVWSLIYGEIFVNIEPMGGRTPEVKNILLEGYKKYFAESGKKATDPSKFEQAFDETLRRQDGVASSGINAETLTMIRTRFLLEWDDHYNNQYPYKLFELHRQFLQEGLFDAYNQWLFGSVQNLAAFQNWTNVNGTAYNEFVKYQRGRLFKIPEGQYYHR